MSEPQSRRYAQRSTGKKVTISFVLPVSIVRYIQMIAKHTNRSASSVASEILEDAIHGTPSGLPPASEEKAS